MNEIPDFISVDEDFASLFEAKSGSMKIDFKSGDAVKGKITLIDKSSLFVDIGARCEGIIPIGELLDNKGVLEFEVGDEIDAWVISDRNGEISLTVKLSGDALNETFEAAFTEKIPVEGKVIEERKGGYTVNLSGNMAFCPYSQMDSRPGDASLYLGQTFSFLITKIDDRGAVVSRRDYLNTLAEKQREKLQEELVEGDEITGVIRHIERFGFFVDIGGVDGLVPASEVSWKRNVDLNEFVSVGDEVSCKILALDWEKGRITLSLRACLQDPWDSDELFNGATFEAKVSSVQEFGAFLELIEGVDGLLHISQFKGIQPEVGESLKVKIDSLDLDQHRVSLSLFKGDVSELVEEVEAKDLTGTVENIKPYGVFMGLSDGRSGLLHVSQLDIPKSGDSTKFLEINYAKGTEHKIEAFKVEGGKISLCLPGKAVASENTAKMLNELHKKNKSESFGSLGGLFDGLDL
ncbi:S1 RNA-binding domain-containing protein [Lentisphaera profundi]|uniref:S1 RNA-binding domain-containing protein n=1 Tax=Lentisphaera profundi TaxID=1658616 RepID=A0ABY7VRK0_9BACT|nr:S1 RNA-binding domain-containing protein [Lentisphaera profundi]WDE95517.1 S1 RNA-binding domain-containing protein [Lentisphaera profundi]